ARGASGTRSAAIAFPRAHPECRPRANEAGDRPAHAGDGPTPGLGLGSGEADVGPGSDGAVAPSERPALAHRSPAVASGRAGHSGPARLAGAARRTTTLPRRGLTPGSA